MEPTPSVTIPEGHPDLNLAAWLDRRREQIGPWSDYIIREVGKLEREIAQMRSSDLGWNPIETAPRDGTNFIGWDGKRAFRCSSVKHYEKWPHQDGGLPF